MGENTIKNIKFILRPLLKNIIPICLYENSKFNKYKKPPSIMLDIYKYNKFTKVYFIFLYPNVINTIKILIIILNKNKIKLFMLKNKKIILIPPIKAPNIILVILIFLLSINDTVSNNIKSIAKFNIITKSKYIFI